MNFFRLYQAVTDFETAKAKAAAAAAAADEFTPPEAGKALNKTKKTKAPAAKEPVQEELTDLPSADEAEAAEQGE